MVDELASLRRGDLRGRSRLDEPGLVCESCQRRHLSQGGSSQAGGGEDQVAVDEAAPRARRIGPARKPQRRSYRSLMPKINANRGLYYCDEESADGESNEDQDERSPTAIQRVKRRLGARENASSAAEMADMTARAEAETTEAPASMRRLPAKLRRKVPTGTLTGSAAHSTVSNKGFCRMPRRDTHGLNTNASHSAPPCFRPLFVISRPRARTI